MADHIQPEILENTPYGNESPLQNLDICILDKTPSPRKLWIIYIHGGAWRDPLITSTSFAPTRSLLLTSPSASHISALASLNYRLSPHPSHPSSNHARHPDHINDILLALSHLQSTYSFTDNYILVGHSCGATLALQVAMSRVWNQLGPGAGLRTDTSVPQPVPPIAVLGVEGIYDLPALIRNNPHPVYAEFVAGAFGEATQPDGKGGEVDVWAGVSPTAGDFKKGTWETGRYVMLAHSRNDGLVEWEQVVAMERRFKHRGWKRGVGRRGTQEAGCEVLELAGEHDQIWQEGKELSRAIETCVSKVVTLLE
ncbi:alpha/beta-hydrolase [Myriangium duriaei CBS 260.36]|uniref:Kynurenine formamidase n=1 Tax=Myriangium duriaei CBS 260.36 TaxID=1168546 RepID=A0A9P4J0K1_9PEZI|nr:alpha/beta-hydrolase [Myriangium duriaei CBS 260.36]